MKLYFRIFVWLNRIGYAERLRHAMVPTQEAVYFLQGFEGLRVPVVTPAKIHRAQRSHKHAGHVLSKVNDDESPKGKCLNFICHFDFLRFSLWLFKRNEYFLKVFESRFSVFYSP